MKKKSQVSSLRIVVSENKRRREKAKVRIVLLRAQTENVHQINSICIFPSRRFFFLFPAFILSFSSISFLFSASTSDRLPLLAGARWNRDVEIMGERSCERRKPPFSRSSNIPRLHSVYIAIRLLQRFSISFRFRQIKHTPGRFLVAVLSSTSCWFISSAIENVRPSRLLFMLLRLYRPIIRRSVCRVVFFKVLIMYGARRPNHALGNIVTSKKSLFFFFSSTMLKSNRFRNDIAFYTVFGGKKNTRSFRIVEEYDKSTFCIRTTHHYIIKSAKYYIENYPFRLTDHY